ncbi:MAG: hypothetical protein ACYC3L_17310 [Gemmatimonadaceae bacterium]
MAGRYYSVQFTDPSTSANLPMSANVRRVPRPVTIFSAGPAGREP